MRYLDNIVQTIDHCGGLSTFVNENFDLEEKIDHLKVSLQFYTFSHGLGATLRVFINNQKVKTPDKFFKCLSELAGETYDCSLRSKIKSYIDSCKFIFWPFVKSLDECIYYHNVLANNDDVEPYYFCLQFNTDISLFTKCVRYWFIFSTLMSFEILGKSERTIIQSLFRKAYTYAIRKSFPKLAKLLRRQEVYDLFQQDDIYAYMYLMAFNKIEFEL